MSIEHKNGNRSTNTPIAATNKFMSKWILSNKLKRERYNGARARSPRDEVLE